MLFYDLGACLRLTPVPYLLAVSSLLVPGKVLELLEGEVY
jgi:hypothetical protein